MASSVLRHVSHLRRMFDASSSSSYHLPAHPSAREAHIEGEETHRRKAQSGIKTQGRFRRNRVSSLTRIFLARCMSWDVRWDSGWLLCTGSSFSGTVLVDGFSDCSSGSSVGGSNGPSSSSVTASPSGSRSTSFSPFCAPSSCSSNGFSVNSSSS